MAVTGGESDGYKLDSWAESIEYREVSTDGTEENTKQQERENKTFRRTQIHFSKNAAITAISADTGSTIVSPSAKISDGTTATATGTWIIASHEFIDGAPGEGKIIERQVLKLFSSWSDS